MRIWITSSSKVENKKYLELAKDIANVFIERKDELLCGGLGKSMMGEIFDAFESQNMPITCVTLDCYHENLEKVNHKIIVDSTFERAKVLYDLADVIVFLPGGTGSLSEIFSCLEEHRTISNHKKLILYNDENFYEPMLFSLKKLVQLGFNEKTIEQEFIVVNTIEELKKKVSEENE